MGERNEFVERALKGEIICNTGQVDAASGRALDKLVRVGKLAKWRGHWYPHAGANHGIGPLKSCWGLPGYLASPFVSNPSPLNVVSAQAGAR